MYIYKSYGLHHCLNLVTDRNNFASGVLIRAIEIEDEGERYASGPGLVSRSLKIGLNFNSLKIYANKYLRLYDCGFQFNDADIINTKRIVSSAPTNLQLKVLTMCRAFCLIEIHDKLYHNLS